MHGVLPNQSGPARSTWGAREGVVAAMTLGADVTDYSALIVAVAARQDRAAFSILFSHFAPRVKSYLLRLGAAAELAEELAQEALLTVWRRAVSYDPAKAAASTWIFTIARNLRIDALRRERRPELLEDPVFAPDTPAAPDQATLAAQQESRIAEAVRTLPAEQAEVIRLAFFSDKPHSEIAELLRLPLGTVKSRVRLAMTRLRALLDDFQ
jgi:RNA polymerase sigma-70 factor (ECF subfamily)